MIHSFNGDDIILFIFHCVNIKLNIFKHNCIDSGINAAFILFQFLSNKFFLIRDNKYFTIQNDKPKSG